MVKKLGENRRAHSFMNGVSAPTAEQSGQFDVYQNEVGRHPGFE